MKLTVVRTVLLVGAAYFLIGIVFGARAGAASGQGRVMWRWGAWALSAAVFGGSILYERAHARGSARVTALHASSAAALGALGLAIAANVHAHTVGTGEHARGLALSLVIWPVMTAMPAFLVALVAATLFDQIVGSPRPPVATGHDD